MDNNVFSCHRPVCKIPCLAHESLIIHLFKSKAFCIRERKWQRPQDGNFNLASNYIKKEKINLGN